MPSSATASCGRSSGQELGRRFGRSIVVIALLACVSGIMPFVTAAIDQGMRAILADGYETPCSGCPDEEKEGPTSEPFSCSPACAHCLCGPGVRAAPLGDKMAWELPVPANADIRVSARAALVGPPQHPALDGLLRPPRA